MRGLCKREELARLETHRNEKVAGALRGAEGHRRCPHVDEALLLHRTADCGDHCCREAQVPLHAVAPQVEVAIAKASRLLDSLVVELEGKRLRARDDLEVVDLDLDFTRGDVRVDGLGRATDHITSRMDDEL